MVTYRGKLGVALSGGAAHGLAHVGVLKVLESERIPIHMIAGSSAGSIAGAAYATGLAAEEIELIARGMRWKDVYNITPSRMGLLSAKPLEEFLDRTLPVKRFERLKMGLRIIATDLRTGKAVSISTGELIPAIRASCSLPGLLPPVELEGRMLVDGGVSSGVPTQVLRREGVDIVLVSDVNYKVTRFAAPTNLFEVIVQSLYILSRQAVSGYIKNADLIVAPEVGGISWQQIECAGELIAAGEKAMRAQLPALRKLLTSRQLVRRVVGRLGGRRLERA